MGKKYQPSCKKELKELLEKDVRLGDIDTSLITDMTELFLRSKRKDFDGLETWDTSNVTGMSRMFCMAEYFNHPIECWDVSKVRDMSHMFSEAFAFDQPLEGWDVSNAENMRCMFYYAKSFNRPLEAWNVSNVENMALMFDGAERFDQPLDRWDVSRVETAALTKTIRGLWPKRFWRKKMRSGFGKFLTISLFLTVAAVSAFGYEPPFFRNETIEVPGRHTLYLGYEKTDGEANPRLYPQLTGKEQRGDVTVFRFRFRERGVYRLTFQQQNHTTAETAVLEREMRVGTEANPTSGDSSPQTQPPTGERR